LCGSGFVGVLYGWDFILLFSLDLEELLLFFLCIGHSARLFFLFLQYDLILVGDSFCFCDRFLNLFVYDIELVIFMDFMKSLLILLKSQLSDWLLFWLIFNNLRCHPCVHLNSFGCLFFILLSELDHRILLNIFHVLQVIIVELLSTLSNIFLQDLYLLFLPSGL